MKTKSAILRNTLFAILPALAIFTQSTVNAQNAAAILAQGGYSNVAIGKTATASSTINDLHAGMYGIDGSMNTRFASGYSDNQWLSVDLGKSYLLSLVMLTWEKSYGKDFDIAFSNNGSFTDLLASSIQVRNHVLSTNDIAGTDTIITKSGTVARYVRLLGIRAATSKGYSIWEMQIFGATSNTNLFPVSLTNLTVTPQNNTAILEWTTVTEYSNAGFSIERSNDGIGFTTVGFITGRNAGSVASRYSFTDQQAPAGKSYYRLKQTWMDGKIGYSGIIGITVAGAGSINIYPVPVRDRITVDYNGTSGENVSVILFNASGLPVYTSKFVAQGTQQAIVINRTAGMNAGQYYISVKTASSNHTEKIVLQ